MEVGGIIQIASRSSSNALAIQLRLAVLKDPVERCAELGDQLTGPGQRQRFRGSTVRGSALSPRRLGHDGQARTPGIAQRAALALAAGNEVPQET